MDCNHQIANKVKTHCYPLCLFVCGLFTVPTGLYAQHYPAGSEGIKAGSAPAPGLYAKDYNSFYYSGRIPGFYGQLERGRGFSIFTYTQAPRFQWIMDWDFLGADYGIGFRIPFT